MTRTGKQVLACVAITVIAVVGGIVMSHARMRAAAERQFAALQPSERNLAVFDAACALIEEHYIDKELFAKSEWSEYKAFWREKAAVEQPVLFYTNVLNNFAFRFPHSHVIFNLPESSHAAMPQAKGTAAATKSNFADVIRAYESGPGFYAPQMRRANTRLQTVDEVQLGSPAERAGITPGWAVVNVGFHMDSERVSYTTTLLKFGPNEMQAIERTGTPPGVATQEEFAAYVAANAVKVEFDLRPLPTQTDFETRELPGGITYVRFDGFTPGGLAGKAMDAIDDASTSGLILDLRRNTGGRRLELERISGRLLGDDTVIGYTRTANEESYPVEGLILGNHYEGPLMVLIGPRTMSAAEVVAAAVQDNKRGKLIGRSTNGSVLVGRKFDLPDGGTLMIPVEDFLRAGERPIEGVGVEPDIYVLPTLDDVRAGRDPVLERALQEIQQLRSGIAKPSATS